MSKKLTTSTNDVLDTDLFDDTIKRIDTNGDYTLHISDDVKIQQYAITGRTGVLKLTFDRPIIYFEFGSVVDTSNAGFGTNASDTEIIINFQNLAGGVSIVYCFGVVFLSGIVIAI